MKRLLAFAAVIFLTATGAQAQFGHRSNPSWGGLSDQVKAPVAITAANTCPGAGCVTVTTWGASTVFVSITGTWVATLQFSCSNDNWATVKPILAHAFTAGAIASTGQLSTTVNGDFAFPTVGFQQCGIVATAFTSQASMGVRLDADPSSYFGTTGAAVSNVAVVQGTPRNATSTSAVNTANTVTVSAVAGQSVHLVGLDYFTSAGTATLTIQDGATTIFSGPASAARTLLLGAPGLLITQGNSMTVTVGAAGVGNTSTLNVIAAQY